MRRLMLAAALCIASPAFAEDWLMLTGPEIEAALTGRELTYENGAVQTFGEGGGTIYSAGAGISEGRWRIEGDAYCSNWPPTESWSCYILEFDGESGRLRFSGSTGDVSVGSYSDE